MPLKDLLIDVNEHTEQLIEEIVTPYARYDNVNKRIVFLHGARELNVRSRILLYLCALRGWPFVSEEMTNEIEAKPVEIEKLTGIPGGSLRPLLKQLLDDHLIQYNDGKYSVSPIHLPQAKAEILRNHTDKSTTSDVGSYRRKRGKSNKHKKEAGDKKAEVEQPKNTKRKSRNTEVADKFQQLVTSGWFSQERGAADLLKRLRELGINASDTELPFHLLRATKSGLLQRKKGEANGRKVWVYWNASNE